LAWRSILKERDQSQKQSTKDSMGEQLQHLGSNIEMVWRSSGRERICFTTFSTAFFYMKSHKKPGPY